MTGNKNSGRKKSAEKSTRKAVWLKMKQSEVEEIRSIGNGVFSHGLRALLLCDLPPEPMSDLYSSRLSVRLKPEEIEHFRNVGSGSMTRGIRRALIQTVNNQVLSKAKG